MSKVLKFNLFLKKLFYSFENNTFEIYFLFFLFLLISILDLIGLSLLPIFFSELFSFSDEINYLPFNINFKYNNTYFIYFLFFALILRTILAIFSNYIIIRTVNNKTNYIRVKLFKRYFIFNELNYSKNKLSDKILIIEKYIDDYMVMLNSFFRISNDIVISAVILIFLSYQNLYITFFSSSFFLMILLFYYKFFLKKNIVYGRKKNNSLSNLITVTTNVFQNIKEVKSFFLMNYFTKIFSYHSTIIRSLNIKSSMITTSPKYIFESIILFSLFIMFIIFFILGIDVVPFIPIIIMIIYAATKILPMINQFIASSSNILNRLNSLDLIYNELVMTGKLDSIEKPINTLLFNEISLQNIYYENTDGIIFDNCEFNIEKNKVIGIFGPSGSGKTTLIDILLGYVKSDSIKLLINNQDKKGSFEDINKICSYTSSKPLLINSTIFENITFGKIDSSQHKKINSILEIVEFKEYINSLSLKIFDNVEENGKNFSDGQKQRIAIARSLFFEKKIIILDEALSLLDEVSQKNIILNIKNNLKNQTLIIISHNLDIKKYCDINYEIKNKKIIKLI